MSQTYQDAYNEYLDEVYGEVSIAGMTFNTSYALKNLDETAYI